MSADKMQDENTVQAEIVDAALQAEDFAPIVSKPSSGPALPTCSCQPLLHCTLLCQLAGISTNSSGRTLHDLLVNIAIAT